MGTSENISRRLEQLSERLVNITRRNKSIRLLRKSKRQCFDVAEVEALRPGTAEKALGRILSEKSAIVLAHADCPVDPRGERYELFIDENEQLEKVEKEEYRLVRLFQKLETNLTHLYRNANLIEAETGARDLYLGYPWISGVCDDAEATFLQAPLLLFPVQLTVSRRPRLQWEVTHREGSEPIFNEALNLALEQYHQTSLSDEFADRAADRAEDAEVAASPGLLIDWFAEQFSALGIRIEGTDPGIAPLPEYLAAEVPKTTQGFRISGRVVIGYFPQAGSALRADFDQLILSAEKGEVSGVLAQLLDSAAEAPASDGTGAPDSMDEHPEADTCWVKATDASQERAMLRSRHEPCLVMHGPPGTGKSQVIVNLISDAMSRGERVLLCCQKRAALDVVYRRLEALGLAKHVAPVHDYSNDRKALYRHIDAAMVDAADEDEIKALEREAGELASKIDAATSRLKKISSELHRDRECGVSARALYTAASTLKLDPEPEITALAHGLNKAGLDALCDALEKLQGLERKLGKAAKHWSGRKSFAQLGFLDETKIRTVLEKVEEAGLQLARVQESCRAGAQTWEKLEESVVTVTRLFAVLDESDAAVRTVADELISSGKLRELKASLGFVGQMLKILQGLPPRPARGEPAATLEQADALELFNARRTRLFRFLSGEWRRAKRASLAYLLQRGLPDDPGTVATEAARARAAYHWEKLAKFIAATPLEAHFDGTIDAQDLRVRHERLLLAATLAERVDSLLWSLEKEHDLVIGQRDELKLDEVAERTGQLLKLRDSLQAARAKLQALGEYLHEAPLQRLQSNAEEGGLRLAGLARKLKESLSAFDDLQATDDIRDRLGEVERRIYAHLQGVDDSSSWTEITKTAVLLGWLDRMERECPALREVSRGETGDLRAAFREQLEQRREVNRKRLAATLSRKAATPRHEPSRKVDGRHSAEKPWKDLRHQVNKKRRLWPLRRLVHDLAWPLFEIMPCWLVSPETLSAAFPLQAGLFDLVIFDEASQCTVQHGIPAVHRGKRIVIAGDEQQLRPFDLFGSLGVQGDDDEIDEESDAAAVEAESILTLAKTRFPEELLECHYRSRYEELIDFSNHAFYQGRLLTVPPANRGTGRPIEWQRVEGMWENQRNRVEADHILDLLYERLLQCNNSLSFGVITFNNKQQAEILDRMDRRRLEDPEFDTVISRARNPESGDRDEALFVKNIENVQGDERDVIIFSVGYGPDRSGRIYSRFGTLNKEGGDNRLNVAVSRSKQKIIVVASVDPAQLSVSTAKNRGPRLLRSYLEYAQSVSAENDDVREAILRDINPSRDVGEVRVARFDSPFEEQVFDALTRRNLIVRPQVGVSGYRIDLGIVDPDDPTRYLLGIECDGATYHSAATVRERDVYRQRFLESRGWTIHRIWSRNWWRRREQEIAKIVDRVAELSKGPRTDTSIWARPASEEE